MLLLGVIGGLLGSCFNYLNALLAGWRKKRLLQYGPRGRLWEGLVVALMTSTVSFLLPMLVSCQVSNRPSRTGFKVWERIVLSVKHGAAKGLWFHSRAAVVR